MDIIQTSVDQFATGNGIADATPKPITGKCYKGVRVRATSGTMYVGPRGVTADNGFVLTADEEVFIPTDNPSNVHVVGNGNYSWLST